MLRIKQFIPLALLLAVGAGQTQAQQYSAPGSPVPLTSNTSAVATEAAGTDDEPWRLFGDEGFFGFKVTGFFYGTGNYNATNAGTTRYNGPWTQNDQDGVYLNQAYLRIQRALDDEEFGIGATVDLMYGNDYLASQSRGFEAARARGLAPKWWDNQDYGLAIPQAYVELGNSKTNIKLGHFYTPHGYLVVPAPDNFFNTLPYGFMMTNPFTHWGVMGNIGLGDNLSLMWGLVNGWDALDRPRNSLAYMGGIKYNFGEDCGFFSSNVITGKEPENLGTGYGNRTLVTNVLDLKFGDNIEFVLENNLLWQSNGPLGTSSSFNVVPYLFYKLSDSIKLGMRYEYYRDPGGFTAGARWGNENFGPQYPANGPYIGEFQSLVGGINYFPGGSKNICFRPEVRYDWFNGQGRPFDAATKGQQWVFVFGSYLLW